MPKDTAIVIAAIVLPFIVFALTLAWTDIRTTRARRQGR